MNVFVVWFVYLLRNDADTATVVAVVVIVMYAASVMLYGISRRYHLIIIVISIHP